MSTQSLPTPDPDPPETGDHRPAVSACETRPGKLIFIEKGNSDGWIATDVTVELWQ